MDNFSALCVIVAVLSGASVWQCLMIVDLIKRVQFAEKRIDRIGEQKND
jgi:hypothetical protein